MSWLIGQKIRHWISVGATWEEIVAKLTSAQGRFAPRQFKLSVLCALAKYLVDENLEDAESTLKYLESLEGWPQLDLRTNLLYFSLEYRIMLAEQGLRTSGADLSVIEANVAQYEASFAGRMVDRVKLGVTLFRLRLAILQNEHEAAHLLSGAIGLASDLKLAVRDDSVRRLLVCAEALNADGEIELILSTFPEKYEFPFSSPEPIFEFQADPARYKSKPWIVA